MNEKEVDKLEEDLMSTGDYERLPDGSVQLKELKPFPGKSGIRCPNMNCQHDLYVDGNSACSHCKKLESNKYRECHLCGSIMGIL